MKTKIVGHAIIRLIFKSDNKVPFSIYARAMIVEDLQGPIYLGQDIFRSKHIFHSLRREHIILKYKYRTPYVKTKQGACINSIQPEKDSKNNITFVTTIKQKISPSSRKEIKIKVQPGTSPNFFSRKSSVELIPALQKDLPSSITIIPCLSGLDSDFHSTIMAVNLGEVEDTFTVGETLCHTSQTSYKQINEDPISITNL